MRFGILGDTRAWRAGGQEVPLGGPARRALLALLLVRPGEIVSADRLADEIDGGALSPHALQSQVSRLRSALGPEAVIERAGAGYRIAISPDDVDAGRFERLADEGRAALREGDADRAAALLHDALGLWRGPALADLADGETGGVGAARLDERRLGALEDRIEADLRRGDHRGVIPELRELVGRHPLRERLAGLLMRATHAEGGQAEALLVFEQTRERLADELGADPSAELAALHQELLRAPALPGPVAPPAQLSSFVGRAEDVAGVTDLLGVARLVTLTGPGGVGKTRLAVEVASSRGGEACFVELAPLRDGTGLPRTLLGALGLRETGLQLAPTDLTPVDRLVAALSDRALLLVLDNCEHVVEPVAALAERLLAACPKLRVLATSREPLGITGEHLWPVRPLDDGAAVRLFADRASAVRRGFTADPDVVRRICVALDDLPLAIELAAARLRTLDLADLAHRLDDRLGVPTRGSRTADERHRTLRSVVAWSWDLLSDAEQAAAQRFTVFAGGATAKAARQVCGAAGLTLESLVDKSILDSAGGRYRMLDTISAYGAERLAAGGDGESVRRAHARYFLELARTAEPHLRRAEQLEWLPVLAAEHDNLLAALRWAVEAKDTETALELVASMSTYLWVRGLSASAAAYAVALLDVVGTEPPAGLDEEYVTCVLVAASDDTRPQEWRRYRGPAEAALAAAWGGDRPGRYPFLPFHWLMRNVDEPDIQGTFALILRQRDGAEPWARAAAHFLLGFSSLAAGDLAQAEQDFTAAADGFRALGDRWGMALALDALAGLASSDGDRARAIALTNEALAFTEQLGALGDTADLLVNRGDYQFSGDRAAARADYEKAAGLARRSGSSTYLAAALRGLGDIALRDGDLAEAQRLYEEAIAGFDRHWVKSVGNRVGTLIGLGRIAETRGELATARSRFREAIESAAVMGASAEGARAVEALVGLSEETKVSTVDALRSAGLPESVIEAVSAW
jgi:predicted ATPase/DNA-binding SARP family transcriptional activator